MAINSASFQTKPGGAREFAKPVQAQAVGNGHFQVTQQTVPSGLKLIPDTLMKLFHREQ